MSKNGLFIGDVAKHSGASRKALRLYDAAGILAPPRRTAAGYRVYGSEALELLAFIRQAQRLGFTLEEIKEIVSIQRSGSRRAPAFTLWCSGSGLTWIDDFSIWPTCGSAWTRCYEAGGRDAERPPCAFTSNSR